MLECAAIEMANAGEVMLVLDPRHRCRGNHYYRCQEKSENEMSEKGDQNPPIGYVGHEDASPRRLGPQGERDSRRGL